MGDGDNGLQAERTRLAWRRTGLAMSALPLLGVSRVATAGSRASVIVGFALVVAFWGAALLVAGKRMRALAAVTAAGRAPVALALLVTALALLGTLFLG